jgi:ribosomal protein L11 methyltransferase
MPSSADNSLTTVARLDCDGATARRVADAIAETFDADSAVAAFEDANGQWTVEAHFAQLPDETTLREVVAEVTTAALARALVIEAVAARDWVAASLAGLKPVAAGRFLVHGAHDRARIAVNRVGIEIEAALAFGTGHHGTTQGCLLALDRFLKCHKRRARVLDIGTGTGVLAIAAARALRRRVIANDIDRGAVDVARANARTNAVAPLVEVIHAGGLSVRRLRARQPYDLVLANILLQPLKRLAAPIAGVLAPNACVVVSGLLLGQASAAIAAYRAQGLVLAAHDAIGEWATLVFRRGGRFAVRNRSARRLSPMRKTATVAWAAVRRGRS